MKDNGSTKRLMSVTMDCPPQPTEDDKKSRSKDQEKAVPASKAGKAGKKAKAATVVDGR